MIRLLILLVLPSLVATHAGGVDGHRAVDRLAELHLSRRARREVRTLLGSETLVMVSTWPNEIRYSPEFKDTAPWHYVDSPLGVDRNNYEQHLRAQPTANAYNQLLMQLAVLNDRAKPLAERVGALKFVVHLVGDVHQPLHTGRAENQGGNKIKVTFRGKETNLHNLWDSGLLDYQGLTCTEMGHGYNKGFRAPVKYGNGSTSRWSSGCSSLTKSPSICMPKPKKAPISTTGTIPSTPNC